MTPGAESNIRPNRYQLASIKCENVAKIKCGPQNPSAGTDTPPGGPNYPRQGPLPLGRDHHYAIYPMEDCILNMKIHKTYLD